MNDNDRDDDEKSDKLGELGGSNLGWFGHVKIRAVAEMKMEEKRPTYRKTQVEIGCCQKGPESLQDQGEWATDGEKGKE